MAENPSPEDRSSSAGLGVAVALFAVVSAVLLRTSGLISDWPLVILIFLSFLAGIVVEAFPRLAELNLGVTKLSVRLHEVKEAEKRIYAREETIQKLMLSLADLAVMEGLNIGRLSGTEWSLLMRQWRDKRIDTILSLVDATPEQKAHLRRYPALPHGT